MIWSLFKVLLFVLFVVAATFGAGLLMDSGGAVRVALAGWEFSLGPLQTVIAVLLLVLAVWLVLKALGLLVAVLRFLNGDETAVSRYFDRNRERRGYQALADGMLALAAGEGRLALIKDADDVRTAKARERVNLVMEFSLQVVVDPMSVVSVLPGLKHFDDDEAREQIEIAGQPGYAKAAATQFFDSFVTIIENHRLVSHRFCSYDIRVFLHSGNFQEALPAGLCVGDE